MGDRILTQEMLAAEERRVLRELAKRKLSSFCEYAGRGEWQHSPHLDLLCGKVEEAEEWINGEHDEVKLIMVSLPPRYGKSEIISRNAPAWFLGRNPNKEVILTSYGAGLATDLSRDARRIFRDVASPLFNIELAGDTKSVGLWHVKDHHGKVQAAGAGGPITGRGAHLAIIDDPIKNMAEAESPTNQRKLLLWFKTTLLPRMAPSAAILLVAQRWSINDLTGQLLEEAKVSGLVWDVISLSAIAEENDFLGREVGEPLWPGRFSLKRLEATRKALASERLWQATYQQNPAADVAGALWKYGVIESLRVAEAPQLFRVVITWDPATTSKSTSDKHGILVCATGTPIYNDEGIEKADKHAYVLEDLSDVYTPDQAANVVLEAYERWNADKVLAEINQGGDWIESLLRTKDPNVSFKGINARESKRGRAEPVSSLYIQGRIHHVGIFTELEKEQTTWTGPPMPSPNRLDALVHCMSELFELGGKKKRARTY